MKVRIYQYEYNFDGKNKTTRPMLIDDFYQNIIGLYKEIHATGRQNIKLPAKTWFEQLSVDVDIFIVNNVKMRFLIMITELDIVIPEYGYSLIKTSVPIEVPSGFYLDDRFIETCDMQIYTNPKEFITVLNNQIKNDMEMCRETCNECSCLSSSLCKCKICKCVCDINHDGIDNLAIKKCTCGYINKNTSHRVYPEGTHFIESDLERISAFTFHYGNNHNVISVGMNSTYKKLEEAMWVCKIKIK